MEKQLYAITVDVGAYEDSYTSILFVTDDFEKGSAYVNKNNEVYQSGQAKVKLFHANDYKHWLLDNPYPSHDLEYSRVDPKRNRMREKQEQHNIQQEQMLWLAKSQEFLNQWLKDHLTQDEYEMYFEKWDCPGWSIDPVKWF